MKYQNCVLLPIELRREILPARRCSIISGQIKIYFITKHKKLVALIPRFYRASKKFFHLCGGGGSCRLPHPNTYSGFLSSPTKVTPRSLKADGLEAPLHTGCVGSVDTTQYEGGATISTDSLIHGCSLEVLHMPPLQAMHP